MEFARLTSGEIARVIAVDGGIATLDMNGSHTTRDLSDLEQIHDQVERDSISYLGGEIPFGWRLKNADQVVDQMDLGAVDMAYQELINTFGKSSFRKSFELDATEPLNDHNHPWRNDADGAAPPIWHAYSSPVAIASAN